MPKVLRVTSKKDGFRRAGLKHPSKPIDHPVSKLTKAQIEALKNEPMLVVQELDLKDEKAADEKPAT